MNILDKIEKIYQESIEIYIHKTVEPDVLIVSEDVWKEMKNFHPFDKLLTYRRIPISVLVEGKRVIKFSKYKEV